ncbi:hypothetical protein O0L34_g975 [Tuta absoluta]|nr:hypothetical protein O0L34_g975 [Tuta absoluta]
MSNTSLKKVETVTLYEEYRLIEKDDNEVNVVWRGVQLLLFFLAFVFGSFCTFCHHMLMYMFDDKCVLYPKLITLKDVKKRNLPGDNKLLYDYMSNDVESLPVDFVTTHWVEKSVCYLPMYVPLWSGICGLIWTTMFLMCSSGSHTLTGLQRPWRILPTVFIFSLAMGGLSVYTSLETQQGLTQLCNKLGQLAGTNTCSYTINVATMAYDRRIRGVYPAIRLAIISAWLHSLCWIGSAITVMLRVILVVDFRLVKVRVDLQGNIENMLERHEKHIRTDEFANKISTTSMKVRFVNKGFGTEPQKVESDLSRSSEETVHFLSKFTPYNSVQSLVPDEMRKLTIRTTKSKVFEDHRFIVDLLHDIVDSIKADKITKKVDLVQMPKTESYTGILRQQGQQNIKISSTSRGSDITLIDRQEAELLAKDFRRHLENEMTMENFELMTPSTLTITPGSSSAKSSASTLRAARIKSSLKNKDIQTEDGKKETPYKVQISSLRPSTSITQERDDLKKKAESAKDTKITKTAKVQILSPPASESIIETLKAPENNELWDITLADSTSDLLKTDREDLNKEKEANVSKISSQGGIILEPSEILTQTVKDAPESCEWTKSMQVSTITIVPETESEIEKISKSETKTSGVGETFRPDQDKKIDSSYTARFANFLTNFVDEDTKAITTAQDSQQQQKIEKAENVDEKEKGILIHDDEVPGPSRSSQKQSDPKENEGQSKKTSKKEKQE